MRFGEIIKKAWHITWHYRWLWILGMFAGITGGGSGGGGGSNWNDRIGSGTGSGPTNFPTTMSDDLSRFMSTSDRWLPAVLLLIFMLVVIGLAFAIIGIGARGGLVWAVNELEEGRSPRLGEAWNAGFHRFWSIFGLGLLLQLPLVLAAIVVVALAAAPIIAAAMRGSSGSPAMLAPMCGVLAIGLPVLLVAGVVLGVMYITGLRFIILEGMSAPHAAGEAWRAFRARLGDHALMYFIGLGLNVVSGLALAVPLVIVALVALVPAAISGSSTGRWEVLVGAVGLFVLVAIVLGLAFTAVWGTFTSALWTIFYRRLTGREPLAPVSANIPATYPPPAPGYPAAPSADPGYAPPVAPPQPPMYAPPAAPPPPMAPPPIPPPPMAPPPASPEGDSAHG